MNTWFIWRFLNRWLNGSNIEATHLTGFSRKRSNHGLRSIQIQYAVADSINEWAALVHCWVTLTVSYLRVINQLQHEKKIEIGGASAKANAIKEFLSNKMWSRAFILCIAPVKSVNNSLTFLLSVAILNFFQYVLELLSYFFLLFRTVLYKQDTIINYHQSIFKWLMKT